MMRTDKPTTTASAPETRIADLKGHINYDEKLGCWCIGDTPIDPQHRTIPAEKPTAAPNYYADAMVEDLAETHAKLLAQAAQLAEACRIAQEYIGGANTSGSAQRAAHTALFVALAAYEAAR